MNATKNPTESERAFLDRVYSTYTVDTSSQNRELRRLSLKSFAPHIKGERGLELGCSDGYMTEKLASFLPHLDVVDGSKNFLDEARKRQLPNVRFIYSLFEEFTSTEKYDCVFASFILEHVADPIGVMKMAKSVLKPDGRLFITVPNARALSRQLALHMGLLKDLKEMTQNDFNHGHRRVYDRVTLNRDIAEAGFESISQGGVILKILADFQMDQLIDQGMLKEAHMDALYSLGLEYPDLCGSMFSICRLKQER